MGPNDGYEGVKFKTIFLGRLPPKDRRIKSLASWCRKFGSIGLAPPYRGGSCGNLSFRAGKGCIITAAKTSLGEIKEDEFVEVVRWKKSGKNVLVYCRGKKEPSSESCLHMDIYRRRKDINAVFHGHDEPVLKHSGRLGIKSTKKEQPYGTVMLLKEVRNVISRSNYVVMKNHGIISLGKSIKAAGQLALRAHKKAILLK